MSTNDRLTVDMGTGIDESLRAEDIYTTAKHLADISDFVEAIRRADLARELRQPGFKTLFAPSNEALRSEKLPQDRQQLARMLSRHIVAGSQTEADLRTTGELKSIAGDRVSVRYESGGSFFGAARIVRADIPCANGHIHIIDRLAK